jgi:iron-sulfur cluster assembly protein
MTVANEVKPLPISFSAAAIEHLHKQLHKHAAGSVVRLYVKTAGCSGLQYKLDIVATGQPDDLVYTVAEGITLYIAAKSLPFIEGTIVDYVKEGLNAKFQFINPLQKGSCGCGESFYI